MQVRLGEERDNGQVSLQGGDAVISRLPVVLFRRPAPRARCRAYTTRSQVVSRVCPAFNTVQYRSCATDSTVLYCADEFRHPASVALWVGGRISNCMAWCAAAVGGD